LSQLALTTTAMNRQQYIAALEFWFAAETAGAIAGEVAMLLRSASEEKRKLDLFRILNSSFCAGLVGANDPVGW